MCIQLNISQEAEALLRQALGADLDRLAVEALAIEGYRAGKLSAPEVGRLVGISDRWALNRWLADRQVPLNYTADDLDADRKTLDRLLGKAG